MNTARYDRFRHYPASFIIYFHNSALPASYFRPNEKVHFKHKCFFADANIYLLRFRLRQAEIELSIFAYPWRCDLRALYELLEVNYESLTADNIYDIDFLILLFYISRLSFSTICRRLATVAGSRFSRRQQRQRKSFITIISLKRTLPRRRCCYIRADADAVLGWYGDIFECAIYASPPASYEFSNGWMLEFWFFFFDNAI